MTLEKFQRADTRQDIEDAASRAINPNWGDAFPSEQDALELAKLVMPDMVSSLGSVAAGADNVTTGFFKRLGLAINGISEKEPLTEELRNAADAQAIHSILNEAFETMENEDVLDCVRHMMQDMIKGMDTTDVPHITSAMTKLRQLCTDDGIGLEEEEDDEEEVAPQKKSKKRLSHESDEEKDENTVKRKKTKKPFDAAALLAALKEALSQPAPQEEQDAEEEEPLVEEQEEGEKSAGDRVLEGMARVLQRNGGGTALFPANASFRTYLRKGLYIFLAKKLGKSWEHIGPVVHFTSKEGHDTQRAVTLYQLIVKHKLYKLRHWTRKVSAFASLRGQKREFVKYLKSHSEKIEWWYQDEDAPPMLETQSDSGKKVQYADPAWLFP